MSKKEVKGKSAATSITEVAAKQSANNKAKGKPNVRFSLSKKIKAVYVKNGKYAKKGTETVLSEKAFKALEAKGLVKEA